jgi:hypothetical protein
MTRELTDCRIFGTLTGSVDRGGDTRQHAQEKLFLADVMEEAPGRAYMLEDYFGKLQRSGLLHLLQNKDKN